MIHCSTGTHVGSKDRAGPAWAPAVLEEFNCCVKVRNKIFFVLSAEGFQDLLSASALLCRSALVLQALECGAPSSTLQASSSCPSPSPCHAEATYLLKPRKYSQDHLKEFSRQAGSPA